MSEPKKVDHWSILATELGAAIPEPEISEESSPLAEDAPGQEEFQPEDVPLMAVESIVEESVGAEELVEEPSEPETLPAPAERPRSSWDLLANELGIEVPSEPEPESEPSPEPAATVPSPTVERAAAERIFDSLFSSQESCAGSRKKIFPRPRRAIHLARGSSIRGESRRAAPQPQGRKIAARRQA